MPRLPIVGGNWKSNLTARAAKELARALAPIDTSRCEVVVAPVAMHIPLVKEALKSSIRLAAQNCAATGMGAYTGEISADHIVDMGLEWVILGHSERRSLFGESDEVLAKKLAYAQHHGLKCIICIGELKEQRQNGTTMDVCIEQMTRITQLLDPTKVERISPAPFESLRMRDPHAQPSGLRRHVPIRIQHGFLDSLFPHGHSLLPTFVAFNSFCVSSSTSPWFRRTHSPCFPHQVVIAYEPVWAIGTGLTATPEMAQETHRQIRSWIASNVSSAVAEQIRIQYGGSVKASNAPDLAKMPDIDGFLVGGASLKPDFHTIVKATAEAKAAPRPKL